MASTVCTHAGQGVNQALEDAVLLAQAIRVGGLTEKSLRSFEAQRIPRVQEILAFQIVSHCIQTEPHVLIQHACMVCEVVCDACCHHQYCDLQVVPTGAAVCAA